MKTVLIPGANCGLGYECAKTILSSGGAYHVVMACRSAARAADAMAKLKAETNNANVSFLQLDLSSLASVRSFAATLGSSEFLPISFLVLNAGIGPTAADGTQASVDGYELIFATNHLGHFLLTNLIRPYLAPDCRIAVVTSNLHNVPAVMNGGVPVCYPGGEKIAEPDSVSTRPMMHYAQSKLCNLYFTYELARRLSGTSIRVNAFNPGLMLDSQFHKTPFPWKPGATAAHQPVAVSGRQLAELVIGDKYKDLNAKYVNRGVEEPSSELSRNAENALELWETSKRLAGIETTI